MNVTEAIKNLEVMSEALEKKSMEPKIYNSDFAHYLEVMSHEMRKNASELRSLKMMFGEG